MKAKDLKLVVKEKYAEIIKQANSVETESCCTTTCGCNNSFDDSLYNSYTQLEGHNPEANLRLGCGVPTEYAGIQKGHHVLDLGSGAGNDCFIARSIVGASGKVTGLDFTDEMIDKARKNADKLNYKNIEFIKGDIEDVPFDANSFDVVISNCVLNLVPDKMKAFKGIYKVLKPGGHFCVSDIVLEGELPAKIRNDAAMYSECVSGAMQITDYINTIKNAGFINPDIKQKIQVNLPEETLTKYASKEELEMYLKNKHGIYSITITAYKK